MATEDPHFNDSRPGAENIDSRENTGQQKPSRKLHEPGLEQPGGNSHHPSAAIRLTAWILAVAILMALLAWAIRGLQ